MIWFKEALRDIIKPMPIKVEKIHSDNGRESINCSYAEVL